jgi:2-C-methyl-D-erythritol 4-phosphate cytidylyltransferase
LKLFFKKFWLTIFKIHSYFYAMNVYAIIVAGGTGSRMNNALPKQFLPIHGKPILYYSIKAFLDAIPELKLIIVLHPDFFGSMNGILQLFKDRPDIQIVAGGATRFESVKNGINSIINAQPNDVVMVHDAARPMVSELLINKILEATKKYDTAIPVINIPESVRQLDGEISIPIDRASLRMVQTPQAAIYKSFQIAFNKDYSSAFTDEATVLEASNFAIHLIDGDYNNIKITTPDQLLYAEYALK